MSLLNWGTISSSFSPVYYPEIPNDSEKINGTMREEKENSVNKLEIPKINISAPLIFSKREKDVKKDLNFGVVVYPTSSMPGEGGTVTILGHSAPYGWPKVNYQWIFTDLKNLEKGDEIFLYYNGEKFVYEVKEKIFLTRGATLPPNNEGVPLLYLISCWPPGKDVKRILVIATLQHQK